MSRRSRRISSATGQERTREPIQITTNQAQAKEHFLIPAHYEDSVKSVLISKGAILDRVEKLASDIISDYSANNNTTTLHLICVLKGGNGFFNDLQTCLRSLWNAPHVPYTFDFIRCKSYEGTSSTGDVQISACDLKKLAGRDVVLVEDIVDTGLTMSKVVPLLKAEGVRSLKVASLLEKRREDGECHYTADYVGYSIPDEFVVGYCLDYNDAFRDLQHICCISESGIDRFKDGVKTSA